MIPIEIREPGMATGARDLPLVFRMLQVGEDAAAFSALNEEWISHYFVLEEKDKEQLGNPDNLLRKGGHILMVRRDGVDVGCVALVPMSDGRYELSKMAVARELRGLGIGRALLLHALAHARAIGATSLFLGSNTRLAGAVRLYEWAGFHHVDPERLPKLGYTRANVFMEFDLRNAEDLAETTPPAAG